MLGVDDDRNLAQGILPYREVSVLTLGSTIFDGHCQRIEENTLRVCTNWGGWRRQHDDQLKALFPME